MALSKITYTDKETLNPLPSVADKNKVTDDDMNEIKSVVNSAIDQVEANTIPQQATAPVSPSENDLWIDTDEPGVINIDNTPSTSSTNPIENQAITNYVNTLKEYNETEKVVGKWIDNKPIYRRTFYGTTSITLNSNSWASTGVNISNVDTITECRFINIATGTGAIIMPMCAYYDTATYNAVVLLNLRSVNFTSNNWYLIIEYTKTTD